MRSRPWRHNGVKLGAERLEDRRLLAVLFSHDSDDAVRAIAPSEAAYDNFGLDWVGGSEPFDDSAWATTSGAPNGVGYDRGSAYDSLLGLDLEASMYTARTTMFVRAEFDVDNPAAVDRLTLALRYDDGFIAWLNGVEVARANSETVYPAWSATATGEHQASTTAFDTFDLAAFVGALQQGTNVLAIRGLNASAADDDALLQFTLTGESRTGPPLAVDDVATSQENTPVVIDVLANDEEGSDPINPASVTIATPPTHGTAVANADGTITFTPNTAYNGPDSFTYTVRDNTGTGQTTMQTLVASNAPARALVPPDNSLGTTWRGGSEPFNDSPWQLGTLGVGYDFNPSSVDYSPFLGLNVQAMQNNNTTVYIRVPFTVSDASGVTGLSLRMRYDDGFAAFVNGVPVASGNAPSDLSYNSRAASGSRTDTAAVQFESFDLTPFIGALRQGSNVLAIHGLNQDLSSSDLLMQSELIATYDAGGQLSNAATVTIDVEGVDFTPIARDDQYMVDEGQTLTVDDVSGSGGNIVLGPGQFAWRIESGGNGHVYQRIQQAGTWAQARTAAQTLSVGGVSGHLATITSAAEQQFLASVLPNEGAWIGAYQDTAAPDYAEPAGGWRWVTGEPWGYTNWRTNEPSESGAEHFASSEGYTWNDLRADYVWNSFWVEYPVTGVVTRQEVVIPAGSAWRYRDNGQLPAPDTQGNTWKQTGYDDASWASGPAQLGYGDADEATVVNCGPSRPNCNSGNFITTWFRKHFTIESGQAALFATLFVELLRDDGGAVYINGVEMLRHNLPGVLGDNSVGPNTPANATASNEDEYTPRLPEIIDLGSAAWQALLHDGDNVVAVEIHQVGDNSSDISFDLRLSAAIRVAPGILTNDTEPDGQTMTAVLENPPTNGTLDLADDGTFTYTPNAGFAGVDAFTYRASDGLLASDPATVTITVVHAAPTAVGDMYSTDESTPLVVNATMGVLANDADSQGHALTASVAALPANGTLALNPDGSFTYTPTLGYNGQDSFTYTASDGSRASSPATVTITINSINTPPIAVNDAFSILEGVTLGGAVQTGTIKVLNSGYDEAANAKLANAAVDADFVIGPGSAAGVGTQARAARSGLPGSYLGDSSSASSTWLLLATLDQPLGSYFFDATVIVPGGDGSGVRLGNVRYAADNKLVSIFVNSTEVFTQPPGLAEEFFGFQSLGNLGLGAFRPGVNTIRFEVFNSVGGPSPMGFRLEGVVEFDPAAVPSVLANDSDVDSPTLTARVIDQPTSGVLEFNANGAFRYTPNAGFVGVDTFTYVASDGETDSTVGTVTITVLHAAPMAIADAYAVDEDTPLDVPADTGLLANDADTLGHPLSITIESEPEHGTLMLDADGGFRYAPGANFHGVDTFTYRASDDSLASEPATVTITVRSVNDVPVAGDDDFTIDRGTLLVLGSPGDTPESIAGTSFAVPATGAVNFTAAGGELGFTTDSVPSATELGVTADDQFIVRGNSTLMTVNFDAVDLADFENIQARLDLRSFEDSTGFEQADYFRAYLGLSRIGGPVVLQTIVDLSGTQLKALDNGPTGAFTTYTASIPEGFLSATLTIEVSVNSATERVFFDNIAFTGFRPNATNLLLANDGDADGDALSIRIVTPPAHGAIEVDGEGAMTYTPDPLYVGDDTFTYVANDGQSDSNAATATIHVLLANLLPTATDDAYATGEDEPLVVPVATGVLANDADLDEDLLSVRVIDAPQHGTLSIMPDGSFTYTPTEHYFGADSFTYVANDGSDDSNLATVAITIAAANDPPVAVNDAYTVAQGDVLNAAPPTFSESILASSPLAYWRLGETTGPTAADQTGRFPGQYTGGASLGESGALVGDANAATRFDGATGYVRVPYNTSLNLSNNFSVEAWIKPNSITGQSIILGNHAGPAGYALGIFDGRPTFTTYGILDYRTQPLLQVGQWYHVAVAFDASNDASFYLNGEFVETVAGSSGANLSNNPLFLGATPNVAATAPFEAFNGVLDEVAIFGRVLSPIEILAHYAAGIGEGYVPEQSQLIALNSIWRYRDDIANGSAYPVDSQSDLWNENDYDDAAWPAGPAILGYDVIGAGPVATTIGYGGNQSDKYRTALFRRTFDIADADRVAGLAVDMLVDDGAAIYINGREVLRHNLPGTLGDATLRTDTLAPVAGDEGNYLTFAVDLAAFPGLFVDGTNTIAVEVHQTTPGSTDLGFDLSLTATVLPDSADSGVLGNDTDVEEEPLTAELVSGPQHGSLELNADGTFTYTPAADFYGNDSFTYRAFDGAAYSNVAAVAIVVTRRLFAVADEYAIAEDALLAVPRLQGVLVNDPDSFDPAVTAMLASAPAHGTLSLAPNGAFHYRPNANFFGVDSFTYRTTDGIIASEPATATITVAAVNDAPSTQRDVYVTNPGQTLEAIDTSSEPLVLGPNQFVWPMSAGGNGHVYEYVTAAEAWDVAAALAEQSMMLGRRGHLATVTSAAEMNFFRVIGEIAGIYGWIGGFQDTGSPLYSEPAGGWRWITGEPWGFTNWASTEPNDFGGNEHVLLFLGAGNAYLWNDGALTDLLPYWVEYPTSVVEAPQGELIGRNETWRYLDGIGNSTPYPVDAQGDAWNEPDFNDAGWRSGGAILGFGTINVGPVVTPIRMGSDGSAGISRTALFRNTFDVPRASRVVSLSIEGLFDDGAAMYINGREVLRYNLPGSVGDGTLRTETEAMQAGDEDRYNRFAVDLAQFPNLLVEGANVIAVELHQLSTTSDAGFDLAVTATYLPDPAAGGVLGNDTDAEGDAMAAVLVAGPYRGTLAFESDGTFSYTPAAGFEGVDQFTYRARDGIADSAETLVTINVGDANEAPLAADDRFVARSGTAFSVPAATGVLKNDFDANGDPLAATVFAPPTRGTLSLAADGSFVYTPQGSYIGIDTFTYRVADGDGAFGFATTTIRVVSQLDPINGIPLAGDDAFAATAGAVRSVAAPGVLSNDQDPEQRPLVAVIERAPWHGSLSFAADGSFTYTPRPGFTGEDSFTYRASDGNTSSAAATATIGVAAAMPAGGPIAPVPPGSTLPGSQGSTTSPGTLPIAGDANGDGRVDRADLAAVVAAYGARTESPGLGLAADVNRDGRVSMLDAIAVRNAMAPVVRISYAAGSLVRGATPRLPDRNVDRAVVAAVRLRPESARRPLAASAVDAALDEDTLGASPRRSTRTARARYR